MHFLPCPSSLLKQKRLLIFFHATQTSDLLSSILLKEFFPGFLRLLLHVPSHHRCLRPKPLLFPRRNFQPVSCPQNFCNRRDDLPPSSPAVCPEDSLKAPLAPPSSSIPLP